MMSAKTSPPTGMPEEPRRTPHSLLLCLLLVATLTSCGHDSPTEPPSTTPTPSACLDISGDWGWAVANTTCGNSSSHHAVSIKQTGCNFTTEVVSVGALVSGRITGTTATIAVTWRECAGIAEGTADLTPDRFNATFVGTKSGERSYGCCGPISGTFTFVKNY